MSDLLQTSTFQVVKDDNMDAKHILAHVYSALQNKGYDPIIQIVGFLISGDPTYITSYCNARSLICQLERDEIMEELVRSYIANTFHA